jgi:predicted RNA-binding Zn-ribbon protein involved in translation (DUF1610 family)
MKSKKAKLDKALDMMSKEMEAKAFYCPSCGSKMVEKYCKKCGKKIK